MKPIKFVSANTELSGENVDPLPCYRGEGMFLSRWKGNWRERLSILFYGTIWVAVASDRCPPISITGHRAGEFRHPRAAAEAKHVRRADS